VPDLRAPALAAGGWAGGLLALLGPGRVQLAVAAVVVPAVLLLVVRRRLGLLSLGVLAAGAAVAGVALLQQQLVTTSPVTGLAADRAVATVRLQATSDARAVAGRFGELRVQRARVRTVAARGSAWVVDVPVVVLADEDWPTPPLGATVRVRARLAPADDGAAALVTPVGEPVVLADPGPWWDGAAAVRRSVRDAVADRGREERELVPALVVGDDAGFDPGVAEDFRTTGLTHLLAVSGTNLTLVVGFLVVLGRWVGVRGRGTWLLAGLGIVGFVLLARTEPSVVRAAAMGTVALVGMGGNGLARGTRCLGVAVLGLLLVEPGLATSVGFALSALATGGILLLAPRWRDAMQRWLPRWAAEAIAVPLAAQVACTPLVAGISGQVSLVAVGANLAAAPAVAPATVLGLAGGLVGLVWAPLGEAVAAPGAWSAGWIVAVARHGAALPTPAVGWGTGPLALAVLTVGCLVGAAAAPRLLRHPATALGCAGVLVAAVLVRPPTPGWPPRGWVLAMCDVGQGDGLVLNAGGGAAVVVDAGPDPRLVDGCLDRLDVSAVPLVVLTHFHADHVDGLPGVLAGRDVGTVESTPVADPPQGAADVARVLGHPPAVAPYGESRRVGDVLLEPLWPPAGTRTAGAGDGSTANDASVVLLVEVRDVRILLTGDVEPPGQEALARSVPGLGIDVLKVPHHGSRHQDADWLASLGAAVALVSVGAGNDYGHPAPDLLATLEATGADVWRTDLAGDVVVVQRGGEVGVVGRR
jgi:competence protein ComEC